MNVSNLLKKSIYILNFYLSLNIILFKKRFYKNNEGCQLPNSFTHMKKKWGQNFRAWLAWPNLHLMTIFKFGRVLSSLK